MNIIINGGSRGIGAALVKVFSTDLKNKIIVTGRNKPALKKLASEAEHGNVIVYSIDLEVFDNENDSFLKFVQNGIKTVDILINNAGALIKKDFMDINMDEARKMMETNFWGIASVIRVLKPLMKKGSHIVNISSMGGFQGSSKFKGMSFYSASKAALSCLSECLAVEFSESGIYVNCLALGSVQTKMFAKAFPGHKASVSADEIARFIADFAINGKKFFNGKILPVSLSTP